MLEEDYKIRFKPKTTPKKLTDEAQLRDCFETPNYAIDLIIPYIPKDIKYIWEPAAGNGKIADRLRFHGYKIARTDIRFPEKNLIYNFSLSNI